MLQKESGRAAVRICQDFSAVDDHRLARISLRHRHAKRLKSLPDLSQHNFIKQQTAPERLHIRATIFVERDSQKGILIGRGGAMLKRIGTDARRELEAFFGIPVFLGLTVQVRRAWRKDDRALREFGFRLTS